MNDPHCVEPKYTFTNKPFLGSTSKSGTALAFHTSESFTSQMNLDRGSTQCTIYGLRSIIPFVSSSAHDIWQDVILLVLYLQTNPPLAKRLTRDLKVWEDESPVDWEHTLMLVMARYNLPSPQSRGLDNLPTVCFAVGNVCSFGDEPDGLIPEVGSDGSQLHVHEQGLSSVGSNSELTATNSLASYQGHLVKHDVNSGVVWTSYIVDLSEVKTYSGGPNAVAFGMDITLNLPPHLSQHMLWYDTRHGLSSTLGTGHGPDSLLGLELVVSISVISRIQLNVALSEHWNKIVSYLKWEQWKRWGMNQGGETPHTITDDNPFAQMKLYFHRHNDASASPREYWGFWSLNSDPTAETGLEGCEEEIKLEVTTLPMENELDKAIKRREEERLAGIPGSYN